jgi:hypothetical protein
MKILLLRMDPEINIFCKLGCPVENTGLSADEKIPTPYFSNARNKLFIVEFLDIRNKPAKFQHAMEALSWSQRTPEFAVRLLVFLARYSCNSSRLAAHYP